METLLAGQSQGVLRCALVQLCSLGDVAGVRAVLSLGANVDGLGLALPTLAALNNAMHGRHHRLGRVSAEAVIYAAAAAVLGGGWSPLFIACTCRHTDVVRCLLVEARAQVNLKVLLVVLVVNMKQAAQYYPAFLSMYSTQCAARMYLRFRFTGTCAGGRRCDTITSRRAERRLEDRERPFGARSRRLRHNRTHPHTCR
jgi:hypothetical protein